MPPKRKFPQFYEKAVPAALVFILLAFIVLLVIVVLVLSGVISA
jgi:hypothetical protein